jgi:phosphoribosylanthranilate isomerase
MTTRTRIKFCGITRVDDALAAVSVGVDAIGLVMTRRSRRFVDLTQARAIRRALPPFVAAVTLFMDDDAAWIAQAVAQIQPDYLQFHGSESAEDCVRYERPYLKAVAMASDVDLRAAFSAHPHAAAFLLDGHATGDQGGSGKVFDWTSIPRDLNRPIVLAGGLTAENVRIAVETVRPYAVDVSSGIESAPGIKDVEKMARFAEQVRHADKGN